MAGKGGGAWKVAYADFVTAMMAFFLVMWITSQSKEMKAAVASYFREPSLLSRHPYGGASPVAPKRMGGPSKSKRPPRDPNARKLGIGEMATPLASPGYPERVGPDNPHMLVIHDGSYPTIGTLLVFTEDSVELSDEAKRRLGELLPMLRGKRNKIEVRGHASRQPPASGRPIADGWHLCFARCLATKKFLEENGVEPERIRLSQAGVFEPYSIRANPTWQARNSRVEVYMLNELAEELIGTSKERDERFRSP